MTIKTTNNTTNTRILIIRKGGNQMFFKAIKDNYDYLTNKNILKKINFIKLLKYQQTRVT